jgi:hypothetical protein
MANKEEAVRPDTSKEESAQKAKSLRVRVVDHSKADRPAVNIRVPIGVVKFGLQMAQAFSPGLRSANLDWDGINAMIEEGEVGKIVDVEDEAQQKTIEVWIE